MLRTKVLEAWNSYQAKITKLNQDLEFLTEQTCLETALPNFPVGINQCRNQLDSWTSIEFSVKLDKNRSKLLAGISNPNGNLEMLTTFYLDKLTMFKELTAGWKKERDSYARYKQNNANGGPTIAEVDDW